VANENNSATTLIRQCSSAKDHDPNFSGGTHPSFPLRWPSLLATGSSNNTLLERNFGVLTLLYFFQYCPTYGPEFLTRFPDRHPFSFILPTKVYSFENRTSTTYCTRVSICTSSACWAKPNPIILSPFSRFFSGATVWGMCFLWVFNVTSNATSDVLPFLR